jgi:transposase, IS30 family
MGQQYRLAGVRKDELWARWKAGESVSDIAKALDVIPSSVWYWVRREGGCVPPQPCRSPRVLSAAEREEISRGLAAGESLRRIAFSLGRQPSTISREVARHGGRNSYRAAVADRRAWRNARRPKICKLAATPRLRDLVASKLAEEWSPQQISGWLAQTYPDAQALRVSTETIYRSLFVQTRGVLKRELMAHLRTRRRHRRAKASTYKGQARGRIPDAVSIRQRPAEVEDRAVPGHWEGDLLLGKINTRIITLVERQTRYVMLIKIDRKDAAGVADALAQHIQTLPKQLRGSITWDRGTELADHKRFSVATDVAVYFCDPASPWQRGTNENTNGLLRQYLPKGTDMRRYTQADLDAIALKLNTRPRKTLGFMTPIDRFKTIVASTP